MQELIVYLIIATAVIYLARQVRRTAKGESDCGTCSSSAGCAVAAIAAARRKRTPWQRFLAKLGLNKPKQPPSFGTGFEV